MFRRCVMSQVRRLTTVSSHAHQTNFKSYRSSHMIRPPLNQLLVFRSLSTATPRKKVSGKDSETHSVDSMSFDEWVNNINISNGQQLKEFIQTVFTLRFAHMFRKMMKNKYDDKLHVKRIDTISSIMRYEFTGLKGASTVTAEIRNSRQPVQLVVSGHTFKSNGSVEVIKGHATLPYNDYSEAKKSATFYPHVGCLVVEISKFNKGEFIKMEIQETKA